MQTVQLPAITVTLPVGANLLMTPSSYVPGEPMVKYVTNTLSFTVPQRAVNGVRGNFLANQMVLNLPNVSTDPYSKEITVMLHDPVFQDAFTFILILDFLNRSLDTPATLRKAHTAALTDQQWGNLIALEQFIFYSIDRNPYWTGLTCQDFHVDGNVSKHFVPHPTFRMHVQPNKIIVAGPNRFSLKVDLTSLTKPLIHPVSLLAHEDMEFPFPVDFEDSFFIPNTAITCTIDGTRTVCEGVLYFNGHIRIEPIQAKGFRWFHFNITPRFPRPDALVYGAQDEEEEEEEDD